MFQKLSIFFEFQRSTNLTDPTTVLKSELCELIHSSSKVVIHKICLQLGKKLHLVL